MYYFLYVLLSEGFVFAGVISFWFCILELKLGDWNILVGAIIMFILFGIQNLVNKTKCVKELKERLRLK